MVNDSPPRRSTRSTAGKRLNNFYYYLELPPKWSRVYLDMMGHCRLQKCIQAVRTANSSEIKQLQRIGKSFMAIAISAASTYGACGEAKLLEYAHAITDRGLDANDSHEYFGNTATTLAAYHGYVRLLEYLLDLGSSLDSNGIYGNALEAAVRNGQHAALELLLQKRPNDIAILFANDRFSFALSIAIRARDTKSVRILTTNGPCKPTMSDRDVKISFGKDRTRRFPMLRDLYPNLQSVVSWSKPLHWSFPTSDRHALNLLWYTAGCKGEVFPREVWLLIFSFTGRGWFKCKG